MVTAKVTADKNGNVIGVSQNNPEYGYIRVEQQTTQISDDGWLRNTKRSALIKGKTEDLMACNYKEGSQISGKIVVRESLTPFNPENPDRDLKIAGDTGVICRIDDQPIYRQTFFTSNLNAQDELITHTNKEEIKEVQAAQRTMLSLTPEAEPSLP
jgi:hypothetical protein